MGNSNRSEPRGDKKAFAKNILRSSGEWALKGLLAFILIGAVVRTCTEKHYPKITDIVYGAETIQIFIDDGRVYEVRSDSRLSSKRNLALLYVGKEVWTNTLDKDPSGCQGIAPVKQSNMRTLSTSQYMQLVKEGFRDSEIAYSFRFTSVSPNPNPEKPTYGGTIEYGAPQVCAFLLKK